jgi:aminomethyltransferase
MPIPSPFHDRTHVLCESYRWKDWAGYYAVSSYGHSHEKEYFAIREASGLLDVTPLYKYEVRGDDAADFLSRMMVRDITKLKVDKVTYCCWRDEHGKVVDDGTVTRLDENHYRVTAADPSYRWMDRLSQGFDVEIEDSSASIAALALQGPTSRDILKACTDIDLDELKFFSAARGRLDSQEVRVTRTGYTGDLGYEIWCHRERALPVWDALISTGKSWGIRPAGLDALDHTRIEAGFIMLGVDYFSAPKVILESRKSTPYELGLGWTVNLDREPFVGQKALQREKAEGSKWAFVGLELSWEELEALYDDYGLPPSLPAEASREPLPVYIGDSQVGQATSHAWSPVLKRSLALASVHSDYAEPGTCLTIEHTVEFERRTVSAVVRKLPFYNPQRKRKP